MVGEVLALLDLSPDARVLDLTVGAGGHAAAILDQLGARGQVHGVDRDPEIIQIAKARLGDSRFHPLESRFGDVLEIREQLTTPFDGILLDLGVSSLQLDRAERGFSFRRDGPLDMRMDPTSGEPAERLVNQASVDELARILREYGEERHALRIARAIERARQAAPITRTARLADIVRSAVRPGGRIDPATRTFQALRIAVNGELDQLDQFLARFDLLLAEGGRLAVISYHSLEDRRVKESFRQRAEEGDYELLTRRVVRPSSQETRENPRSRSARLRGLRRRSKEESV